MYFKRINQQRFFRNVDFSKYGINNNEQGLAYLNNILKARALKERRILVDVMKYNYPDIKMHLFMMGRNYNDRVSS